MPQRRTQAQVLIAGVPPPPRNSRGREAAAAPEAGPTISTQLVERLREAILSGELPPGAKLNVARVRERFGVSLSPLREALARLLADGLVELEDNRGYRVAPVSLKNLAEVTRLRVDLEGQALHAAVANGDARWEAKVAAAFDRLDAIVRDPRRPSTLRAWEAAHTAFHMALIEGCDMPVLVEFCRRLMNLNDRYRRVFLQSTGGDDRSAVEHRAIVDAALGRDADAAVEQLRAHIQRTGSNLRRRLDGVIAP